MTKASMEAEPHIACLMVTKRTVAESIHSINGYINQTYVNKSLVVVCDGAGAHESLAPVVGRLRRQDIRVHNLGGRKLALGELRNLAVELADGEFVCQWDDDDRYHRDRLRLQMLTLGRQKADACYLAEQFLLLLPERAVYWCDWHGASAQGAWPPMAPNTALFRRDMDVRYPSDGPSAARSEDLHFMLSACRSKRVAVAKGVGFAYLYVAHGSNTWGRSHQQEIIERCAAERDRLECLQPTLVEALRSYELPFEVTLTARNGQGVVRV